MNEKHTSKNYKKKVVNQKKKIHKFQAYFQKNITKYTKFLM